MPNTRGDHHDTLNAHHRAALMSRAKRNPGFVCGRKPVLTDIRITRIETTEMTATEYADAVEALAVLIAKYERHHPST
jgi:hypothetical protein